MARGGRCSRLEIAPARSRCIGRRRRADCCWRRKSKRWWCGPRSHASLDLEALDQFLTYEYVLAPRTILKGIHKLPAGHYLLYKDGEVTIRRYWDAAAIRVRRWSDDEAAEALREALRRATVSQMMADVPLGAFLSGGIDSSTIVAFMSEASLQPVQSFSIGFDDGTYNELPYAREIAALFKTNHRERTVSPNLEELFDKLVVHLDEPFADVSLFPTYLVSTLTREHVTVALSGDGGDELFGGYDAYQAQELASRFAWMGDTLLPAAAAVAAALPPTEKKKGLVNKFKRFTLGATQAPGDLGALPLDGLPRVAREKRLYRGSLIEALTGSDVYRPVRDACSASAGRPAQPPVVCGPLAVSHRRHPGEGRSHEHGDVARDARAIPGCRRHGARVLHARPPQDQKRRAQMGAQARDARRASRAHPDAQEGRLQHPDEELAAARAAAVDAFAALARTDCTAWPLRACRGARGWSIHTSPAARTTRTPCSR